MYIAELSYFVLATVTAAGSVMGLYRIKRALRRCAAGACPTVRR